MEISENTANVLTIIAFVLLIVSGIIIIDKGLPALSEGYTVAEAAPQNVVNANNPASNPINNAHVVTQPPAGTPLPPAPTLPPTAVADLPATLPVSTLSADNRALFDQANAASGSPDSVQYSFNGSIGLNVEAQGQRQQGQLQLSGSGYVIAGKHPFQLKMDLDGTVNTGQKQLRFTVNILVVNNVLYLKGNSPDTNISQGWIGYPVNSMLATADDMFKVGITDPNTGQVRSNFDLPDLQGLDIEQAKGILQLLDFSQFVYTQRLADIDANNAHFQTQVDLLRLLASPQLAQSITALTGLAGLPQNSPNMPDINALMQQAPLIIPKLFKSFTLTFDHYVTLDKRLVSRVDLALDTQLDLSALDPKQAALLSLNVTGTLNLSGYNTVYPDLTAPADAVMQGSPGVVQVTATP